MRLFNLIVMAIGGIALWWMIRDIGFSTIESKIVRVGWWFVLILILDVTSLCCDAAALHTFMRPEERMIPYWRVLGAQASGRAINVLTPGGALGEPVKLGLLMTHAPRARVLSSLVLLNLTNVYLSVAVMIIGTPITLAMIKLPTAYKTMVFIGLGVLVPAIIALGVVIHRGAVSTVVGTLRRVRIISEARAKDWKLKLVEVDAHIRELHVNRSAGTWKGILWVGLSKLVTWTSSAILIGAVGIKVSALMIVGVLSIGVLIRWVSSIVPMGLGAQDGANYVLYNLLGSTGQNGITMTFIDRARSVALALLGLLALAAMQLDRYLTNAKIHRKIIEMRTHVHGNHYVSDDPAAAAVTSAKSPTTGA